MEQYFVKIKSIERITTDTLKIVTAKPPKYHFTPGQATEIAINKTKEDIILKTEFEKLPGENFINILSDELSDKFAHGLIDEDFLKANITDFNQQFYLCGLPTIMDTVKSNW